MNAFFKNTSRGFTVIEMAVVVGIALLMAGALLQFFVGFNTSFGLQSVSIEVASSASRIVNEVVNTVRVADQVVTSYGFASGNYTTSASTLVMRLPSVDASGNILSARYDYVAFYTTASTTIKEIDADASSFRKDGKFTLSETTKNVVFTYDNATFSLARKVEILVNTEKQVRDRLATTTLRQQMRLRNKS